MQVEQISVFLENRAGRLAEITRVLGEAGVSIRALSLADTSDFGILRLIVNDNDKAKAALKEHGFTVGITNVVAVEVEDRPGGLNHILEILSKEDINVEYMYAFVQHTGEYAVIIFRFDDIDAAVKILLDNNIKVLEGKTVYTL
ncbi:MAG: ACT domain-containing protein [Deltaproteobacteria bacterium]|nr:ACT domain-containing protein [Deltaproteobacteria bacterium]